MFSPWTICSAPCKNIELCKSLASSPHRHVILSHVRSYFLYLYIHNMSVCEIDDTWQYSFAIHDDVIKWKHFPRYWPFVRVIHRSPVNSQHKRQWRGALMFSLICVWINGWVNNRETGDLRRYRAHYDVTVMCHCDCHSNAYPWPANIMTVLFISKKNFIEETY